MEEWRQIQDFPDYSVSDQGRVRNDKTDRYLRPCANQQGHGLVVLRKDGKPYTRSATLLVTSAFLEPHPLGATFMTPIHLDGDKLNSRLSNLRYRTRPFAIAYHKQFDYFKFHRKLTPFGSDEPVRDLNDDEVYENTTHVCVANGLLENQLVMAILNKEPVFPTNQTFAFEG